MAVPALDYNPFPATETPKVSAEEVSRLFTLAHNGDDAALEQLVQANTRLVESTVLQLQPLNIPAKYTFTELYDSGLAALRNCIFTGDEDSFKRFAGWWVRQGILTNLKLGDS